MRYSSQEGRGAHDYDRNLGKTIAVVILLSGNTTALIPRVYKSGSLHLSCPQASAEYLSHVDRTLRSKSHTRNLVPIRARFLCGLPPKRHNDSASW